MHALRENVLDRHVGIRSTLEFVELDERFVRKQVVLPLARRAAGEAAYALLGIDKHSVAGDYAPTFLTVTKISCDMVEP